VDADVELIRRVGADLYADRSIAPLERRARHPSAHGALLGGGAETTTRSGPANAAGSRPRTDRRLRTARGRNRKRFDMIRTWQNRNLRVSTRSDDRMVVRCYFDDEPGSVDTFYANIFCLVDEEHIELDQ
jgi:hypothetical protein